MSDNRPLSMLFVCIGNMCRSPMAEAFARHFAGDQIRVGSAGLAATGRVHELVHEILGERDVETKGLTSDHFDTIDQSQWDWIVSIAGMRAEGFVEESWSGESVFWPIPDPIGQSKEYFEEVADDVEAHVLGLLKELKIIDPSVGRSAPLGLGGIFSISDASGGGEW